MNPATEVSHPGLRIRAEVIPKGMSVTKAAELMGVGRPALSNLLNGNAALSPDMATRLEKAFGYPLKDLMDMQARFEAAQATLKAVPADIKSYVPPFLAIKANAIENWVSHNIPARSRLAVFLRTLVHSTGSGLTKVDFPGNDDAERPGWDGEVKASIGTPWIPIGKSGWEFGTNQDPKSKADGDFQKSVKAHELNARMGLTFIFVTPRRWPGKHDWIEQKRAAKQWKDVRAYDASDLEQWLEQSLPGQAWFANENRIPAQDVRSLDKCWADWANVCDPPLSGALFESSVEAAKGAVLAQLARPPGTPILLVADSAAEALAFLSQLLGQQGGEELATFRDRVIVFDRPGVLPVLAAGTQSIIPVAHTREIERELAAYAKDKYSFVIYPRNAAGINPSVTLKPVGYEVFNNALRKMGLAGDDISRLSKESARSLTVLRRRMSATPAMRVPEWASDATKAIMLVPFLFVGAWNSQNEADREALSLIAEQPYAELERICQQFVGLDDAPMWSAGAYRGTVSKIDLLFAISRSVTTEALNRYFAVAGLVLGEDDPALDLEDDKRWAANVYGKKREFSATFRQGLCETLVLLSVHGPELFNHRLGMSTEQRVVALVRQLLPSPLSSRTFEANDRDLPTYAEAAPDVFLTLLENDLKTPTPAVLQLLRPVNSGSFGSGPARSGLLWALEGLSWDPTTLPRAANILARLAGVEINDNWMNKPINSLLGIFRSWMPQTAASLEDRIELMKSLAKRFPEVAWTVCVAQFADYSQVGHHSHKPSWRQDGTGFGDPVGEEETEHFRRVMVEMALDWPGHSLPMLCDLVERLSALSASYQKRVWRLIEQWAMTLASDEEKAAMREKVRVSTLSRRAIRAAKREGTPAVAVSAKRIYALLEPSSLIHKFGWLFRSSWIDESADELEDLEKYDYEAREERTLQLRKSALRDIVEKDGLVGLLELSTVGEAAWTVGMLAAEHVLSETQREDLLRLAMAAIRAEGSQKKTSTVLLRSLLRFGTGREKVLTQLMADMSDAEKAAVLLHAPFERDVWKLVDALEEPARRDYWQEVVVGPWFRVEEEKLEAVHRLMSASRPRAAFSCIRDEPEKLDVQLLFRLLTAMARESSDRAGEYQLDRHSLVQAFEHVSGSPALSLEEKAALEYAYMDALVATWEKRAPDRIPNLQRYIEAHPEIFVQQLVWAYKRSGEGADPDEWTVSAEVAAVRAGQGYKLLDSLTRTPGHNGKGKLEAKVLERWVKAVRETSEEVDRLRIADNCVGKLFSHCPVGEDGVWPCEAVRDVLELVQSEEMMVAAAVGVYNLRGIHTRGEGGSQERSLADKYRAWSQALKITHPYVASRLLSRIVNSYEHDATREDTDADVRLRLRIG